VKSIADKAISKGEEIRAKLKELIHNGK
jgi:hypothetical protein